MHHLFWQADFMGNQTLTVLLPCFLKNCFPSNPWLSGAVTPHCRCAHRRHLPLWEANSFRWWCGWTPRRWTGDGSSMFPLAPPWVPGTSSPYAQLLSQIHSPSRKWYCGGGGGGGVRRRALHSLIGGICFFSLMVSRLAKGFPGGSDSQESAMRETWVRSLVWKIVWSSKW